MKLGAHVVVRSGEKSARAQAALAIFSIGRPIPDSAFHSRRPPDNYFKIIDRRRNRRDVDDTSD